MSEWPRQLQISLPASNLSRAKEYFLRGDGDIGLDPWPSPPFFFYIGDRAWG